MNKKIIFSAGGTGGHIIPAINLMKFFFEKGYEVILVTDKRGNSFVKQILKFKSYELKIKAINNKNFLGKFKSIILIFYSLIQSFKILRKEKANLIIGFGGYVSFPCCFLSKFFNLPLILYEPNMVLGKANKYLSAFSQKIFLSRMIEENLPSKYMNKIEIVGPIINKNIIDYPNFSKEKNLQNFSILVLGGSQGAEIFGEIVPLTINMLNEKGYKIQIVQQCIKSQIDSIASFYKKKKINNYLFEFEKNIFDLILSSDIAITRCGASTTAELTSMLKPFIAVPIPNSIYNHQYLNGKFYEDKGCCWLMKQKNFTSENLFNLVIKIIEEKKELESKINNMKKIYTKNVYNVIENKIKEII